MRSGTLLQTPVMLILLFMSTSCVAGEETSFTGVPVPSMQSFDRLIMSLMKEYQIPGGSVAVAKDGRLVFAHGYGLSDVELKQPAQPDSLFRICSISKPITAVTILKLIEQGKLDLNTKAFQVLDYLKSPAGASIDPRIYDITIRHLLQHSGGWNDSVTSPRDPARDPMFNQKAARALGTQLPASAETIVRYMMGEPLDFTPGNDYQYANFGYCVLGRIIEKITGQNYEQYVKAQVLQPMEITRMRIGHTFPAGRAEGEVRYYDYPGAAFVSSVFPNVTRSIPAPYGQVYIEGLDSCGGWIASAIDLIRFAVSVDGRRSPAFLKQETPQLMTANPNVPHWAGRSYYYGMGWAVTPMTGTNASWWHDGGLPGSSSWLVRTHDGRAWAALFNSAPQWGQKRTEFFKALNQSLWQAASEVSAWPVHDLLASLSSSSVTTSTAPRLTNELLLLPIVAVFASIALLLHTLRKRRK